jgi:hypothetical protein
MQEPTFDETLRKLDELSGILSHFGIDEGLLRNLKEIKNTFIERHNADEKSKRRDH